MNKQLQTLLIIAGATLIFLMWSKSKRTSDIGLDEGINPKGDNEPNLNPLPEQDSFAKPLQACTPSEQIFQGLLKEEEERRQTRAIPIERKNELLALAQELYNDCKKRQNILINDFKDNGVNAPSTADTFIKGQVGDTFANDPRGLA